MVPNEGRSSGSGGEEVEWSTLRGLERARRSISKSDIGSKIDAGRYPLLALLLLLSPQTPPVPALMGGGIEQGSVQWSIIQFRALTELSLHDGCGEITQSMQVCSLQAASWAQHSL